MPLVPLSIHFPPTFTLHRLFLPASRGTTPLIARFLCVALLAAATVLSLRAQTTYTYTDTQTDAGAHTTTALNPITLTIDSGSATQSGAITGAGSVTKTGAGTLLLNGANTYSGGTTISDGTLAITSTNAVGTGAVSISSGATLNMGSLNLGLAGTFAGRISGPGTVTTTGAFNNGSATNFTHSFGLGGTAALNHSGTGTLTLTGASTYTGATTISNGTVRVNGSIANSATTVNSGGTLAGSGSVSTLTVNAGGTVAPGNSPGTLTAGNTTFASGGTYAFEINNATGTAGTNWDLLSINGSLTLTATAGSPFNVTLSSLLANNSAGDVINFNSAQNSSYTFITATGGIVGFDASAFAINSTAFSNPTDGGAWSIAQSGNNLNLNFTASAIPEPSTYAALAGLAALGLAFYRNRRQLQRDR
jgi:autotransporter-associated beta strand protein